MLDQPVRWPKADSYDLRLFAIIKEVLDLRPTLVDLIFHPTRPEALLSQNQIDQLSSGERLLACVALDLWDGSGEVKTLELVRYFNGDNLNKILNAYLKAANL